MSHTPHNPLETLARTGTVMNRMRAALITVCGAGALGSNIVEGLARAGCARLRVIDQDRVEERNLATQTFVRGDVGAHKARMLANHVFRAVGVEVDAHARTLDAGTVARLLAGSDLVIDAFDNSASRRLVTEHCAGADLPCLHAGLAPGYGEVIWNERYRVPAPLDADVCDVALARNLVMLCATIACECAIRYIGMDKKHNYTVTLEDMRILEL